MQTYGVACAYTFTSAKQPVGGRYHQGVGTSSSDLQRVEEETSRLGRYVRSQSYRDWDVGLIRNGGRVDMYELHTPYNTLTFDHSVVVEQIDEQRVNRLSIRDGMIRR